MNLKEYINWTTSINDYETAPKVADTSAWGFEVMPGSYRIPKLKLENASKGIDMSFLSEIEVLKEKVNALSSEHGHTKILVNEKEIELLKLDIQELKEKSKNPLAN